MNITLSDELVKFLEKETDKNRFVAEAIKEKIKASKKEQIKKILIDGYKNERIEGQSVNKVWESGTLDSWK